MERAEKIDGDLAILRILEPGLARSNDGCWKEAVFGLQRAEQQIKSGVLGAEPKRIADHADIDAAADQSSIRFTDATILDERDFRRLHAARLHHGEGGEVARCAEARDADSFAFAIANGVDSGS